MNRKGTMEIITKLGVSESLEFADDYTALYFYEKGKVVKVRKIPRVDKVLGYKRLGVAYGMNLPHCFYLGRKYTDDFMRRVAAYKISGGSRGCAITVTFYQRKKKV